MTTIIIADGLTNATISPQHQFAASKDNIGQREIARLLGRGKSFGHGPLAAFLAEAVRAHGAQPSRVIMLAPEPIGDTSPGVARADDLVEPIAAVADRASVVPTAGELIPWQRLLGSIHEASGQTDAPEDAVGANLRFLVVGCHTDKRILTIAAFLRRMLGAADVAVSSHLVGSSTQEAHLATLRHNLPGIGVRVLLDLEEAAAYAGLDVVTFAEFGKHPCVIEPSEARDAISADQRRIIELLCLHWTKAHLRPLAGGFSGSALFLADGWKGDARTEPMVLKIDAFNQMRRELSGYYQVKDFFGKHVPTFGYPVTEGDALGVGMELAAMEGSPETLQDTFEEAETDEAVGHFMARFEKALSLLSEKLYRNTRETAWVVPYRGFGLHAAQQLVWLKENADLIIQYVRETGKHDVTVDVDQLVSLVRLIAKNEDGVDSEVCLAHGDLNFANVICDEGNNIWFIDWTHSGTAPVELDFAKLENDVKFVMTKTFDVDDLPRLRSFEEYLLAHRIPPDVDGLPDALKFAKWDLRFRKILTAVRLIRQACFALKQDDDWLVYQIALLKYATHTLSFDKRRGRGECEVPALAHALYSVEHLTFSLVADDFHLKIRAERPPEYPARLRISIDEAPWALECPGYDPPYYVHPSVLEHDRTARPDGWADPEDVSSIRDELAQRPAKRRDALGRPLNPRGRTGIGGRGLLGYWGCNRSVAAIAVRRNQLDQLEVLLGGKDDDPELGIPKGFMLSSEAPEEGLARVIRHDTGWTPDPTPATVVFEGYTYDPRQTDHAWVETTAYLLAENDGPYPNRFDANGQFEDVKWWPLDAETINRLPAGIARFVRDAVTKLKDEGTLDASSAEALLARTG